jgi:hypothetical protein
MNRHEWCGGGCFCLECDRLYQGDDSEGVWGVLTPDQCVGTTAA